MKQTISKVVQELRVFFKALQDARLRQSEKGFHFDCLCVCVCGERGVTVEREGLYVRDSIGLSGCTESVNDSEPPCLCASVCVCDGSVVVLCVRGHGSLTSRPSGSGLAQNRFFNAMPELSWAPARQKDSKIVFVTLYCDISFLHYTVNIFYS